MVRLSFYPIADSYLWVVAAALAMLMLLAVSPRRAGLTRGRKAAMVAIRTVVIVLVVLAMLRPTLVYTKTDLQAATLIVLADQSRSMGVRDAAGNRSRWEALRRTLTDAREPLAAIDDAFELKVFTFDAETHPSPLNAGKAELPAEPTGRQTAIGSVLEDVLRNEAGKRLLGVVLLSDGAQRAYPPRDVLPQTAAARLKHLGAPLYTLRFGQSRGLGQAQDVAVKNLLANSSVFVKNELTVSAEIRVDGYVNRDIAVRLAFENPAGEMEVVATKNVRATADGQLIPVEFEFAPQTPGEYKLTVEAAEEAGELVTTNNRLSTFVNVLKGGLNVLYLEGALRPEATFLARSLDTSADINVDFVRIDPRRPDDRPGDLPQRLQPGKYEVYLLGDLDSSTFSEKQLQDLAEAVSRGAGLMMIGGLHNFGPGGYAESPLADVLPIRMDRLERQEPGGPIANDLQIPGPLRMIPTLIGRRHFALRLAAADNANLEIWNRLPPLEGASRFRGVKPAALILAASPQDQPLLVSHHYGDGRVMAFAVDSTWRWWMRGFETAHKRFWRQVVLWLARKDEGLEGNVWVKLDPRRFGPGQRVEFSVGAETPQREPVDDATFQAELVPPTGDPQPIDLIRGAERTSGSFLAPQMSGDYAIRVTADSKDQVLGSTRARFQVFDEDLELDNASADATILDGLAAMTGGKSLAPEELPDLLMRMMNATESLEVKTEAKRSLWDTWPFFLAMVGLLGTEWFLRKRWGLV
ncbi:MAG: hypothetical protein GXY83_21400 [Rhodopirellula sp.]|nr:hypothetical protein [Rhodopirellula sp.]